MDSAAVVERGAASSADVRAILGAYVSTVREGLLQRGASAETVSSACCADSAEVLRDLRSADFGRVIPAAIEAPRNVAAGLGESALSTLPLVCNEEGMRWLSQTGLPLLARVSAGAPRPTAPLHVVPLPLVVAAGAEARRWDVLAHGAKAEAEPLAVMRGVLEDASWTVMLVLSSSRASVELQHLGAGRAAAFLAYGTPVVTPTASHSEASYFSALASWRELPDKLPAAALKLELRHGFAAAALWPASAAEWTSVAVEAGTMLAWRSSSTLARWAVGDRGVLIGAMFKVRGEPPPAALGPAFATCAPSAWLGVPAMLDAWAASRASLRLRACAPAMALVQSSVSIPSFGSERQRALQEDAPEPPPLQEPAAAAAGGRYLTRSTKRMRIDRENGASGGGSSSISAAVGGRVGARFSARTLVVAQDPNGGGKGLFTKGGARITIEGSPYRGPSAEERQERAAAAEAASFDMLLPHRKPSLLPIEDSPARAAGGAGGQGAGGSGAGAGAGGEGAGGSGTGGAGSSGAGAGADGSAFDMEAFLKNDLGKGLEDMADFFSDTGNVLASIDSRWAAAPHTEIKTSQSMAAIEAAGMRVDRSSPTRPFINVKQLLDVEKARVLLRHAAAAGAAGDISARVVGGAKADASTPLKVLVQLSTPIGFYLDVSRDVASSIGLEVS